MDPQSHWSNVYTTKDPQGVSWYQPRPAASLHLIDAAGLGPEARILDVGGGATHLVDHLLDGGYRHVGVLDAAPEALALAQERLSERADAVEWFATDVLAFESPHTWDLWHDRAVFHFLTDPADQARYRDVLRASLAPEGQVVIATFGPEGPERCSGLDVQRYDADRLAETLGPAFRLAEHHLDVHTTPSGAEQQFLYAHFHRTP
jgi:SAM-dependent methyltransferase